jgi:tellurite methyltransferase
LTTDHERWEAKYKAAGPQPEGLPSPFLMEALPILGAPSLALDLAMGEGRHALALARAGWPVVGLDVSLTAAERVAERARAARLPLIPLVADALTFPLKPASFGLIVCSRFLERGLAGAIARALAPGGWLHYETFTVDQPKLGWGPKNPDYLLKPNELLAMFPGLRVVRYSEETGKEGALARLLARNS